VRASVRGVWQALHDDVSVEALMSRVVRWTIAVVGAAASLLPTARAAEAQVMCNDATKLPNPIIVSGSLSFEPTLGQLAVKLAAEPSPATVIFATGAAGSCAGIGSVRDENDLGGTTGRYYTADGATINFNGCTFASGQKAHIALSDLAYEGCSTLPQPKPATMSDLSGPVRAMVFIVPTTNATTRYLSYAEARTIYGCGVASTKPVAGFSDPTLVFCRRPNADLQAVFASSLGLPTSALTPSTCVDGGNSTSAVVGTVMSSPGAISFIPTDSFEAVRSYINALAFESPGQALAFPIDSQPDSPDRRNVRDGHYTLWTYVHLVSKTTAGNLSPQASQLVGWINGTQSSPNIDPVVIETRTGLIPQCAMRVQRSTDTGLISAYAPPAPCGCAFEAIVSKTLPPGCVACTADRLCGTGRACRHGFCE
jgi:hypothetical protein